MSPSKAPDKAVTDNGAVHPVCSEQVEAWLRSRGVKFQPCRNIPMNTILRKQSRANQARREAIDPQVVETYRQALHNGDVFPPIVVMPMKGGKLVVDGNHRDEAHERAHRTHIAAYELDPDTPSELIALLTAEANVRHGKPTDPDWRGRQASHLLAIGQDPETVANALGLSKSGVDAARRAMRADQRAARLGVHKWGDVAMTTRAAMASITSDVVFGPLAEFVASHGMPAADLKDTISRIRLADSESDALRIVGEVEEEVRNRRSASGVKKRMTLTNPRMRVLTALGAIMAIDPAQIHRLFLTQKERDEVRDRAGQAAVKLMEIEEALNG